MLNIFWSVETFAIVRVLVILLSLQTVISEVSSGGFWGETVAH